MTKPNVFTAVFREVTPEDVGEITHHPKWSAGSWSHAIDDRKEAEAAIQAANARIAQLEADLSFQKQVTDAARQHQAELLERAESAEDRSAEVEAQIAAAEKQEPVAVIGSVFQLLYCRENWSEGLKVGMNLYATPLQSEGLRKDAIQQKAVDHGFKYWRASDAHGVTGTIKQAEDLIASLIGVEVEITK